MTGTDTPAPGLWRNRNWVRLFTGQAISQVGDFIFDTTIVLWIATRVAVGHSWAPLAVGGAFVAVAVPVVLVGPVAGVYVDRWDRRRTMLVTDVVRAALIGALIALPLLGDRLTIATQLTVIYLVVALASAASQFFNPSRFALLAAVVPEEQQARSSGLGRATVAIATVAGPPLAAPLLFSVGVPWALVANAASFVFSYLMVLGVRTPAVDRPAAETPNFWRELREGAGFLFRSSVLRAILISAVVATLGVGALNSLDVFFVTDNLHAAASSYGILGLAQGAGGIVGALIAAAIGNRIYPSTLFWIALALTGVAIIGYSRATAFGIGLALLLVVAVPVTMVDTAAGPILMGAAPQRLLGRVLSVFTPIQQIASIGGAVLATALASTTLRGLNVSVAGLHLGRIDTVFLGGGILVLVAGLWVGFPLRAGRTVTAAGQSDLVPSAESVALIDPVAMGD
jgi:Na+/melibiose symporter-like transporter